MNVFEDKKQLQENWMSEIFLLRDTLLKEFLHSSGNDRVNGSLGK